jgi:exopolyphosphatase / guanosine-5'-triphosphate,3'-diphosphate pyrophosphatase
MQNGTRLAAVDLGSNSFRLEISRFDHGQFSRTEYLKETIRQGSGLDQDRNLTPDAMQRGWDCLARFGERLAGFSKNQVRAVATQTLREARNRDAFLLRGNEILGFPIDIISGREEARLIYLGVAKLLPQTDERRLVADIGGRSTELILGQGFDSNVVESYRVGSIAWSARYFPDGQFSAQAFQMAEIAAKAVLDEALNVYHRGAWDIAYGSAGTIGAVGDVLAAAGWPTGSVTRAGLDWLVDKLIQAQRADRLRLVGMKEDRRPVIAGGLSILRAIFDLLGIDEMQAANGGLRHGLLYDLMGGPGPHSDVRTLSVQRLVTKFDADVDQGTRVSKVATDLFDQLQTGSQGSSQAEHERNRRKLMWAAQLHEIGAQISHSDYHKHGAYILDHADAMGFASTELHKLSLLVLGHRGKLRKLEVNYEDEVFVKQLLTLRLSMIFCHARRDPDVAGLQLRRDPLQERRFVLTCRPGWVETYPLSVHLLSEEVLSWQKTSWSLTISSQ